MHRFVTREMLHMSKYMFAVLLPCHCRSTVLAAAVNQKPFLSSFHRFPGAETFVYMRLLISRSRKYFHDGTANRTPNVYRRRGRNEPTHSQNVVYMLYSANEAYGTWKQRHSGKSGFPSSKIDIFKFCLTYWQH